MIIATTSPFSDLSSLSDQVFLPYAPVLYMLGGILLGVLLTNFIIRLVSDSSNEVEFGLDADDEADI